MGSIQRHQDPDGWIKASPTYQIPDITLYDPTNRKLRVITIGAGYSGASFHPFSPLIAHITIAHFLIDHDGVQNRPAMPQYRARNLRAQPLHRRDLVRKPLPRLRLRRALTRLHLPLRTQRLLATLPCHFLRCPLLPRQSYYAPGSQEIHQIESPSSFLRLG